MRLQNIGWETMEIDDPKLQNLQRPILVDVSRNKVVLIENYLLESASKEYHVASIDVYK